MKNSIIQGKLIFLLLFSLLLPGCDVIVGIFQAGFWTAIILVTVVVVLICYGVYKLGSRD